MFEWLIFLYNTWGRLWIELVELWNVIKWRIDAAHSAVLFGFGLGILVRPASWCVQWFMRSLFTDTQKRYCIPSISIWAMQQQQVELELESRENPDVKTCLLSTLIFASCCKLCLLKYWDTLIKIKTMLPSSAIHSKSCSGCMWRKLQEHLQEKQTKRFE